MYSRINNALNPRIYFSLLFLFTYLHTLGTTGGPIRYLGIENGLSNNAVTCIYQDKYGFMWMGTYDGLNRYDSDVFKIYRNEWGDDKSLPYNHITAIDGIADKILVGSQRGLSFYDYQDAHFHPEYYLDSHSKRQSKIAFSINNISSDKDSNVYVGSSAHGLFEYDKSRKIYLQAALNNNYNYNVQALSTGVAGVWVFAKNNGLCFYNTKSGHLNLINNQLTSATCLLADKAGNVWIGTENGLYIFNQNTKAISKFNPVAGKLTNDNIFNVTIDEKGDLWITTDGGGINIFNFKTGKLSFITCGNKAGSLRSGAVTTVYHDRESRKWIATLRGGVSIIDNLKKPFPLFSNDPFNSNSVINNFILSFCEDEKHNLWIGTDGGGLSYWDTKNNQYTNYTHTSTGGGLSSDFITSVLKTFDNKLWIGSYNGGIDQFNKATGKFKHYNCYNTLSGTIDKNLWKLYEDSKHRFWATCTRSGSVYLYNRTKDEFELFDGNLVNVHSIFEDRHGTIWVGDLTRLIKLDTITKKHRFFYIGYGVRAITDDDSNHLWVGTEGGGLLKYDLSNMKYQRYTKANGMPGNSPLNILTDKKRNLWCSTYNGLTRYSPSKNTFTNYTVSDGIQSLQFNYNAAIRLQSGKMAFGGINGFNLFDPDSIQVEDHKPDLHITSLKINNSEADSSGLMKSQSLADLKTIELDYARAALTVHYTALEYSFPDKIEYAYYLEGWDHRWNYVGQTKSASYTHLDEGNYTLRIKATDTRGNWMPGQISIKVIVFPPWYRTWWAYAAYMIIAFALIYIYFRYREKQAKLKFEINLAKLNVEKEKEVNEKKLAFFTNVSHEFRTPLTLIINPIKDLLDKNKGNADELGTVYKNARRLLGLVDHLLLFRKTESENAELTISEINFVRVCEEVFSCFAHQAKIKKLNYTFESTSPRIEVFADIEKIEISLFNLISNALKFTPDHGHVNVFVEEDETQVYFKISDSGIGIDAETGDKLFDKFYQVKDSNSSKKGFGIGLYLVKVFIDSHKGAISYINNKDGGTTFTLMLQKGAKHFNTDEITMGVGTSPDYEFVNDLIDLDNKDIAEESVELQKLELFAEEKHTIIIIDDNEQIRTYIRKIFSADYSVIEAKDGAIGLELIRKHIPDVIISDIVMDGINGLDLCRMIMEDAAIKHIPVILLTGDTTPDIMVRSIEQGAMDFLRKPFDKELLTARVKSVLRNQIKLHQYFYKEVTKDNAGLKISGEDKDLLNNCIAVIEQNFTEDNFDVYALAKAIGISYPTLFKRIKGATGQSINNFIRFVRLRKAAELLIQTNCNINEAAIQVGISDIRYFRQQFNKQFGVNPSEFVKKHRANFRVSYRLNEFEKSA
ncbi:hybrid sensor histidine kinase/response regulator transcription factor [Mucilaginibacter kameinonensis]|uniref:hybrid sensor histidine kinase/response regulator transcription factor n=1 Tax=Mucilaginibacter kameinonensis TaxID=452286 RepID=UPI000EF83309|nr:hybrid sensor histidine kinase/response regulator transcription factor [Mucilaginibacter kameinonensis]